ncbi:MAG: nicotinate-nucleotide diphosphorylase (carboxylating), partial [Cyclobacteriaceae bacterium]|nr:nicotinate-nucleotide diphosphorylase (carboxylating) [Cyclobacteriaceae bacterium]
MRKPYYLTDEAVDKFIKQALEEDIGEGDHSTLAAVPQQQKTKARLLVKDTGIIAGVELAKSIFR